MNLLKKGMQLIIACLVVSSCATGYEEPADGSPQATLVFQKTISSKLLFRGEEPTIVTYQVYSDDACQLPVPAANFGATSGDEKALKFSANTTQRFVVNMVHKTGDFSVINGVAVASNVEQHNCIGMAGFTPQENRTYTISAEQTGIPTVCVLNVIDAVTGSPPADLRRTKADICDDP